MDGMGLYPTLIIMGGGGCGLEFLWLQNQIMIF